MGRRVLFDVSGLVQWYSYLSKPSGIQRVTESVLGIPELAFHPDVSFVARAIGSDTFYVVDPGIITGLVTSSTRQGSIARLRGIFAQSMRMSHPSRLLKELRAIHLPYVALGLSFTDRIWEGYCAKRWPARTSPLRAIDPTEKCAALVGLGDFWCHRDHVRALIELKDRSRSTLIHLVHDLIAAHSPQWTHPHYGREFLDQFSRLAPDVDQWLVTSKYVAGQLSEYLAQRDLPARPIEIISMGWPQVTPHYANGVLQEDAILQKHGLRRGRYILHVGTIEPRKNLGALFDALTRLLSVAEPDKLRCVLVGRDGWRSETVHQRLKSDAHLRDMVTWLKAASDEELTALYRGARFTVVPSFDEGWGLAVQESLAHGTPCIASPVGGIPEAGLDLVEYVRCDDSNEFSNAIRSYATDDEILARARKKISRRLVSPPRLPSWRDTAATIARLSGLTLMN
jgi:glycosyltransferase involved in cell wall biosynthesis